MKKLLASLLAVLMILSLTAVAGAEEFDAAAAIAGFSGTPEKVHATFVQTYVLDVQNEDYQAFAKDVSDTVMVDMDLTPGDVYYYGVLVEKDGTITEQLVRAEDGTYYASSTTEGKAALESEEAAVAAIGEMMKALSLKTAGYIDPGFFTYTGDAWMTAYILLGSTNVDPQDFWFNYNYTQADEGINAEITADYIGYFGDSGTFEFGKQKEAPHAAVISVTTDGEGRILSFWEDLTSYQALAIISPPVPLVLNGQRFLSASYDGADIVRVDAIGEAAVEAPEIVAEPEEPAEPAGECGTIVLGDTDCTVVTYDFDYATMAFVEGTEVAAGHFVAFQVEAPDGAEVVATVNGEDAMFINGYYCYMTAVEAGQEYVVCVSTGAAAEGEGNAAILMGEISEGCTVVTYDFDYATMGFVEGTEVAPGHFVAFQVEAPEGAELSATVNGEDAMFINGYYCYMTAVEAGGEYTVSVTVK